MKKGPVARHDGAMERDYNRSTVTKHMKGLQPVTLITVTAEHIARGFPEDCERCPIALAIADAFPDLTYVAVGPEAITLQNEPPRDHSPYAEIEVPRRALEFIWDFDDGRSGEPFSFDLDYPEPAVAS
jgi:hypothetical protein